MKRRRRRREKLVESEGPRNVTRKFASTPLGGCFHGKYFIIHSKSC
jgi:hypothetical protein